MTEGWVISPCNQMKRFQNHAPRTFPYGLILSRAERGGGGRRVHWSQTTSAACNVKSDGGRFFKRRDVQDRNRTRERKRCLFHSGISLPQSEGEVAKTGVPTPRTWAMQQEVSSGAEQSFICVYSHSPTAHNTT